MDGINVEFLNVRKFGRGGQERKEFGKQMKGGSNESGA